MGLFDSLLGAKTTDATDAATSQGVNAIWDGVTGANQTLSNTARNAAGAVKTGAAGATDALNAGFGQARNDITNYGGLAQGAITNGVNSAVDTVQGSNAAYAPYTTSGTAATGMLTNALGLNGASGNAAATSAFQADPGYAWQRDQAVDAAARKAASLGMASSGNTLDAITRLSSNLANQGYGNWLSNLQGLGSQGLAATNSVSGNNQAAAGYQYGGGGLLSNALQNTGTNLGNLGTGLGTALGNVSTGMGSALANIQTGLGQQKASNVLGGAVGTTNLNIADANAQDTAASANNGILSKFLGTALAPELSAFGSKTSGLLSSATKGWL